MSADWPKYVPPREVIIQYLIDVMAEFMSKTDDSTGFYRNHNRLDIYNELLDFMESGDSTTYVPKAYPDSTLVVATLDANEVHRLCPEISDPEKADRMVYEISRLDFTDNIAQAIQYELDENPDVYLSEPKVPQSVSLTDKAAEIEDTYVRDPDHPEDRDER